MDKAQKLINAIQNFNPNATVLELRNAVGFLMADDAEKPLKCDMRKDCPEPVAYIDIKGFVYCGAHGKARKDSVRCRKLKPAELAKLKAGEPLAKY